MYLEKLRMDAYKKYKIAARQYGTPYYLFEIKELRDRIQEIKRIAGSKMKLCYAVKANPFLVSYINDLVDKFEVCSPGEYTICKKEKIDSAKIVLSGVYKERREIEETLSDGFKGTYTLESKQQCALLYELARENNKMIHVLIRLTSGNQFGMNKEDIEEIMDDSKYSQYFIIEGIHYYSGTQKKHSMIEKELNEILDFCNHLEQRYNKSISKLEYGPGLYIDYFGSAIEGFSEIRYLSKQLEKLSGQMEVTIELGRYIAALCGKYVTRVVDTKKNQNINYAITDGGIHQLGYHGQMLGMKFPRVSIIYNTSKERIRESWMICGALCTVQDVLLKNFETETLQTGDFIIFHDVGAYAMTDTNVLFLSRDLPLVLVENTDGVMECIRKRIQSVTFNIRNSEGGL